ncbi:helix-turn-helix domain-containing protein [Acinetobacter sp. 1207_04]|uniref:LexA family protein n=1 Tax=Acinetobacter sp. 1207_04 TaxID=2604449 RepID=UPI0040586686
MQITDRINQKMTEHNLSQADLIRGTGAGRATVSGWVNGTNNPSAKHLDNLAKTLKTTTSWLLTGEGIPTSDKNDPNFSNVVINESPLRRIPILDFVQAGSFYESGYDGIHPKGETFTTYIGCKPESVFSLEVSGLSMIPEFTPGDKLVVDAAKEPYPGCYVIAQNGSHEATFKKYRAIGYDEHGRETFELVPLNPDFPIMNSTQQEIRIIGVVVEHLRSFGK